VGIIKYPLDVNSKLFNNVRAVPSNFINRSPLLDHLVAYYKLDGNSNDVTGNGYNGTDTAITYGTSYGKINQGALFNGSSSRILLGSTSSLVMNSNISVSVWIKPSALPTSGTLMTIVGKYSDSTGNGGYDLRLYNNSGTQEIDFTITTSAGTSASAAYKYALPLGTWYHLVGTNDGTTSSLYLNGILVAAVAIGNPALSTGSTPNIGCLDLVGTLMRFFNGSIDEVGVWNRALTSSEVSQLYNNGGAGIQYPFY